MKIIKQGRSWFKRITCRGCEAVLEVEESDVQYKVTASDAASQQYEDEIEGTYYVECAGCGQSLTIKPKDIAKPVAERIKDRK
jgi:ribosomal protein S27E